MKTKSFQSNKLVLFGRSVTFRNLKIARETTSPDVIGEFTENNQIVPINSSLHRLMIILIVLSVVI